MTTTTTTTTTAVPSPPSAAVTQEQAQPQVQVQVQVPYSQCDIYELFNAIEKKSILILDVRTQEEYDDNHIRNAEYFHIPSDIQYTFPNTTPQQLFAQLDITTFKQKIATKMQNIMHFNKKNKKNKQELIIYAYTSSMNTDTNTNIENENKSKNSLIAKKCLILYHLSLIFNLQSAKQLRILAHTPKKSERDRNRNGNENGNANGNGNENENENVILRQKNEYRKQTLTGFAFFASIYPFLCSKHERLKLEAKLARTHENETTDDYASIMSALKQSKNKITIDIKAQSNIDSYFAEHSLSKKYPNSILSHILYIGNGNHAQNKELIVNELRITHVVNATTTIGPLFANEKNTLHRNQNENQNENQNIQYLNIKINDNENENFMPFFAAIMVFMENALRLKYKSAKKKKKKNALITAVEPNSGNLYSHSMEDEKEEPVFESEAEANTNEVVSVAVADHADDEDTIADTDNNNNSIEEDVDADADVDAVENRVFVHCEVGISRSATIVIAYLMYAKGLSLFDAYAFVYAQREIIRPNSRFLLALGEYEKSLFNGNTTVERVQQQVRQQYLQRMMNEM